MDNNNTDLFIGSIFYLSNWKRKRKMSCKVILDN